MDLQYEESVVRNIDSDYDQMRAYVLCSPNLYHIDLSIEQSTKL